MYISLFKSVIAISLLLLGTDSAEAGRGKNKPQEDSARELAHVQHSGSTSTTSYESSEGEGERKRSDSAFTPRRRRAVAIVGATGEDPRELLLSASGSDGAPKSPTNSNTHSEEEEGAREAAAPDPDPELTAQALAAEEAETSDVVLQNIQAIVKLAVSPGTEEPLERVLELCDPWINRNVDFNLPALIPPKTWMEVFLGMTEERRQAFIAIAVAHEAQSELRRIESNAATPKGWKPSILWETALEEVKPGLLDSFRKQVALSRRFVLVEYVKHLYEESRPTPEEDAVTGENESGEAPAPAATDDTGTQGWGLWSWLTGSAAPPAEAGSASSGDEGGVLASPSTPPAGTGPGKEPADDRPVAPAHDPHSVSIYTQRVSGYLRDHTELNAWDPVVAQWFLEDGFSEDESAPITPKHRKRDFGYEVVTPQTPLTEEKRVWKTETFTQRQIKTIFSDELNRLIGTPVYVGYWGSHMWEVFAHHMQTSTEEERLEGIHVTEEDFMTLLQERQTYLTVSSLFLEQTPGHTWKPDLRDWLERNRDKVFCYYLPKNQRISGERVCEFANYTRALGEDNAREKL